MWFDVTAALAEIEGGAEPVPEARPPCDFCDTNPGTAPSVATVAGVATPSARAERPLAREPEAPTQPAPPSPSRQERATPSVPEAGDMGRHGRSVTGAPLTWTGRLVQPEAWGRLTAWERHGPDGRLWCGCCHAWVARETAIAHAGAIQVSYKKSLLSRA